MAALQKQLEKCARNCESKVLRRLNGVSVTLRNVKVKDALEVERHHRPHIRTLLSDIDKLHKNELKLQASVYEQK